MWSFLKNGGIQFIGYKGGLKPPYALFGGSLRIASSRCEEILRDVNFFIRQNAQMVCEKISHNRRFLAKNGKFWYVN